MNVRRFILPASVVVLLLGLVPMGMAGWQARPTLLASPPAGVTQASRPTCFLAEGTADRCGDPADVSPELRVAQARAVGPACVNEDGSGSPLPCRWDAQLEGNGVGHSFSVFAAGLLGPRGRPVIYVYDDGHVERGLI